MRSNKPMAIFKKLISAAVVLFILMHLILFPVNRDYPAKQIWLNDPTYMEECTISISGYYHFNLFTGDTFTGQVTLSDYPLTAESMLPLTFGLDGAFLNYRYELTPVGESLPATMSYDFGIIYSKPMMREVCIIVYTAPSSEAHGRREPSGKGGSWNNTDGYCIVASVGSHREAVDALKKYDLITVE